MANSKIAVERFESTPQIQNFEVGDIVHCKNKKRYVFTNTTELCKIVEIYSPDTIKVITLLNIHMRSNGNPIVYTVKANDFYKPSPQFVNEFKLKAKQHTRYIKPENGISEV